MKKTVFLVLLMTVMMSAAVSAREKHILSDTTKPAHSEEITNAEERIVCIKNDSKFLPLKDLENISVVQIGGIHQNGFVSRASSYSKAEFHYCKPVAGDVIRTLGKNASKNLIILINSELTDDRIIAAVKKSAKKSHCCVINIGHAENLKNIDGKSVIQVFGNGFMTGDLTAQAVFGGIKVRGKFPLDGFEIIEKGGGQELLPTRFQYGRIGETGFNRAYRDTIDSIVRYAIGAKCFPGCQVFASVDGKVIINQGFGRFSYDEDSKKVSSGDIYDIASLTKITAPTLLSMYLTGKKLLDPKEKLGKYFGYKPIDWSNATQIPKTTVYDVSVKSILEHRSGIPASIPYVFRFSRTPFAEKKCAKNLGLNADSLSAPELEEIMFKEYFSDRFIKDSAEIRVCENLWLRNNYADSVYNAFLRTKVSSRKRYKYSDVNMILLQLAEENILKCKAGDFLRENFYAPLGMKSTCYTPYKYVNRARIAPTEICQWTGKYICGDVHDPSAALLGGVSGNAGLFSSAQDLAKLYQMILNGGTYGGRRYLDSATVKTFTTRQPNTGRGLGFDMAPSKFAATSAPSTTYGHTGFTGTCAWIDPENKIVIVFLSNRVHPSQSNTNINKLEIRKKVCQAVYDGLGI